jgi:hypothetical protein
MIQSCGQIIISFVIYFKDQLNWDYVKDKNPLGSFRCNKPKYYSIITTYKFCYWTLNFISRPLQNT